MVIRADGYKIFPGLGVVVLFQSNGFAVMLVYCVHLAHCGKEIEIPCGTYGWFGIFVTINISYSRAEGKKKQELKREDCHNPSPKWNIIWIVSLDCPFENIVLNVIPDVV